MINSDKKFQLPGINKNNPHNIIVIFGLWICVATVALIFILNYSARKKSTIEQKRAEIVRHADLHKAHYTRHAQVGFASTHTYVTKQ